MDEKDFVRGLMRHLGLGAPQSHNPAKYPRSIKLTRDDYKEGERRDQFDDLMWLYTQMQGKEKILSESWSDAKIHINELEIIKEKFFKAVKTLYPMLSEQIDHAGMGIRHWKGETWVVAWNNDDEELERNLPGDDEVRS